MDQDHTVETQSPQLRPALEDDAPLLNSILHAAFEEYQGQLDPPAGVDHETVDTLRQKLQEGFFVIALVDGVPAGCVFYQPSDPSKDESGEGGYLYFGRLAVLPEYRKHGVGKALMDYIEQQAVLRGLFRVQLGVRLAIPHLQAYYSRLGYRPVSYGTHEGYTQPTYVLMEKEVS